MARKSIIALWLVLGLFAALVLGAGLGAWGLSRSDAFRGWLVERIQSEVLDATGARLELAGLEGNLLFNVSARQVSLTRQDQTLLAVERLDISYNLLALLGGRLKISSLSAVRPRVNLPWSLPAGEGGGLGLRVSLDRLSITGGELNAPLGLLGPVRRVEGLELGGSLYLDQRGLRAKASVAQARVSLEGLAQPLGLKLKARLDNKRLRVDELQVVKGESRAGLQGAVELKEPYRLTAKLKATLTDPKALPFAWPLPSPPREPLSLELEAKGPWQQLQVSGGLTQGQQAVSFAGGLAPESGALKLSGQLKQISLTAWGVPAAATLEGSWRLTSQGWPGLEGSRPQVSLELSKAAYQGVGAGPLKLEALLAQGAVEIKSLALSAPWGKLSGQGRLVLPAQNQPLSLQGDLAFQGLKPPAALQGELPAWLATASLNGRVSARGAWKDLAWEVKLDESQASEGLDLSNLEAAGAHAGEAWRVERLKLESPLAGLEARGEVSDQALNLRFNLSTPDMSGLNQALSRAKILPPVVLSGSLEARGRISGPWKNPDLRVRLNAQRLFSRNVLARSVMVNANLKQLGPRPQGNATLAAAGVISGEIFLDNLAARAEFGPQRSSLVVQAEGPETGLALRLESRDLLALPLKAHLSEAWIERGGLGRWSQKGLAWLRLGREQIKVRGLELTQGQESLSFEGDFAPISGEVSAKAKLKDILLSHVLGQQAGLAPKARLEGLAKVQGLLSQPRLEMEGRVRGLEWPGMETSRVEFRGNYQNERFHIAGRAYYGSQEVMELEGRAGLTLSLRPPVWEPNSEGIRLKASAHDLPLALAAPFLPGLQQFRGKASLELNVDGTIHRPHMSGSFSLNNGRFIVASSGQIVERIELDLGLEGGRVDIKKASAYSEGELELTGSLRLPLGGPGALDLSLSSQDLLVLLGTVGQVDVTSSVKLGGDFTNPVLTGRVGISDIVVRYGLAEPAGMADVVILRPGQKPPLLEKKDRRFKLPPQLDGLKVDLRADLGKPTRVSLDDGWLDASGGLHLTKEPGKPLIFNGAVTIQKGLVIIVGKRFEVLEGKADFLGKTQPDPALNAEARLSMGYITVFVSVAGTALDPTINLSSLPPMSQADILSTIIFGRPAAELNKGQSQELSAQALALLGQVGQREMSRIFGPDLSPDVVTVHNTLSAGPSLEAGKYLSEDLYLRYRQNLGPYGGQNVGLEYRLSRYFSVESTVGNTRDNGVDLVFTRDFDLSGGETQKPAPARPSQPKAEPQKTAE
ncbi:MAG: translocation/assembly module TamB domain-containing protein [Desulfarculaceae bacterium]|nr:translocation/assembly module TamB domain-containing protein [Desulfarculaceae bacterium]MCF8070947.1 translocation/assembly module TamB domain-containing protein [Desulfarculaceae bacterium]MCF8100535.1 translocation/assembly module TamB domain-containing protein [Desulfarculaceae bacterium]MCF8116561.1 translocation/assembly module TamB domain-containing protein [Desulfarculaceae bacterium]